MNKTDLQRLRNKITAQLENLESTAATARVAVRESSEVIPNFLQAESDAAKGGIDLENALSVHSHCTAQHSRLKNALLRMDRGEFGLCQECGCEIGLRRLEAVPGATCCIHCQQDGELRIVPAMRPSKIVGAIHFLGAA